ncbi:hypothetical protein [Rhodobacter sp. CZR27]|uniref:hypothetical protein n=1 Tax=Rhodobacter sp. CZR27 TaxID=2033869 RepID=UPI000BBEB1A1|nr:hypothetical protein [Rhodobacter sp. CZR27]
MRLIATSIVYALEDGASALEITDFEAVFDMEFIDFNPSNPFVLSDWASRASAAEEVEAAARADELRGEGGAPRRARKPRRTSRRKAGE